MTKQCAAPTTDRTRTNVRRVTDPVSVDSFLGLGFRDLEIENKTDGRRWSAERRWFPRPPSLFSSFPFRHLRRKRDVHLDAGRRDGCLGNHGLRESLRVFVRSPRRSTPSLVSHDSILFLGTTRIRRSLSSFERGLRILVACLRRRKDVPSVRKRYRRFSLEKRAGTVPRGTDDGTGACTSRRFACFLGIVLPSCDGRDGIVPRRRDATDQDDASVGRGKKAYVSLRSDGKGKGGSRSYEYGSFDQSNGCIRRGRDEGDVGWMESLRARGWSWTSRMHRRGSCATNPPMVSGQAEMDRIPDEKVSISRTPFSVFFPRSTPLVRGEGKGREREFVLSRGEGWGGGDGGRVGERPHSKGISPTNVPQPPFVPPYARARASRRIDSSIERKRNASRPSKSPFGRFEDPRIVPRRRPRARVFFLFVDGSPVVFVFVRVGPQRCSVGGHFPRWSHWPIVTSREGRTRNSCSRDGSIPRETVLSHPRLGNLPSF